MVEQIELTGHAVVERLSRSTVPKRKIGNNTQYYVWILQDSDMKSRLSEMYYGMFRDAVDSLNSVTVRDYMEKGFWIFAPSVDLVNWLVDANSVEDTLIDLPIYYGKLVDVEDQLDEGLSPRLVFLQSGDHKISYDLSNILRMNTFIDTSLKHKQTEKEMIEAMTLQEEDNFETNDAVESTFEDENDDVEFIHGDELIEPLNDDSEDVFAFEEPDDEFEFGDDVASVNPVHKNIDALDDDMGTSNVSTDVDVSGLPDGIAQLINQIETPFINESRLSVLNDEDEDFKAKIDDVRSSINDQLAILTRASKIKLIRKYHDMYDVEASKVAKLVDPKEGLPEVVEKYEDVDNLYKQDIADAQNIEDKKRDELIDSLESKHDTFIADALANAETEWNTLKDEKFVEEPIREWRKDVDSKIEGQHDTLLGEIKSWTDNISALKLKKINDSIIDTLNREVRYVQDELQSEKTVARQDINRTRDRLYDQMLMTRRLNEQRAMLEQNVLQKADVGMKNGSRKPEIATSEEVAYSDENNSFEEPEEEVIENEELDTDDTPTDEVDSINIEDIEADDISKDIEKLNHAPKKSLDEIVDDHEVNFDEKTVISSMSSDDEDDEFDIEIPDDDLDDDLTSNALSDMDDLDNLEKVKIGDLVEGDEDDEEFEESSMTDSSEKKKKGFNLKGLLKKPSLKKKK